MPMSAISNAISVLEPKVGHYWPGQGGIYAGIMPDYEGNYPRHLIVSADEVNDIEWGGWDEWEASAKSPHDGKTNTWALLVCGHEHPAAQWAADYTKDGHTDFHLPSRRELEVAAAAIRDELAPEWYWSSTQHTWATARGRSFAEADEHRTAESKNARGRARAVRTIPVANDEGNAATTPTRT